MDREKKRGRILMMNKIRSGELNCVEERNESKKKSEIEFLEWEGFVGVLQSNLSVGKSSSV